MRVFFKAGLQKIHTPSRLCLRRVIVDGAQRNLDYMLPSKSMQLDAQSLAVQ